MTNKTSQFMLEFALLLEKHKATIYCGYDGDVQASINNRGIHDKTLSDAGEVSAAGLRALLDEKQA